MKAREKRRRRKARRQRGVERVIEFCLVHGLLTPDEAEQLRKSRYWRPAWLTEYPTVGALLGQWVQ